MQKKFVIEMGMGMDLHGQDLTKAAVRAVRNATSNQCLAGLGEICGADMQKDVTVNAVVAVSRPDEVDCKQVAGAIIFPRCSISVREGGLTVEGALKASGERDQIEIAIAAVTVCIETGRDV